MPLEPFKPTRTARIAFWWVLVPLALAGLAVIASLVVSLGFEHY